MELGGIDRRHFADRTWNVVDSTLHLTNTTVEGEIIEEDDGQVITD